MVEATGVVTVHGSERSTRTRGQAFTLEAIVASLVVLGSLLFALQVGGVTSVSGSTSDGHLVEQQDRVAAGVLDTAAANGSVRPTLLYWDDDRAQFHSVSDVDETFYTAAPPTAFGRHLQATLDEQQLAYNVDVLYVGANDTVERHPVVRNGIPSDDATRVTRTVTLYDDDRLLYANGTVSNTTVANTSFYVPDRYPGGPVYNVVRVEVVVWPV